MPTFYYNIRSPKGYSADEIGIVFADPDQARVEAVLGARGMLAEDLKAGRPIDHQQFEVTDEAGALVFTLRFRDVVDVPAQPTVPDDRTES